MQKRPALTNHRSNSYHSYRLPFGTNQSNSCLLLTTPSWYLTRMPRVVVAIARMRKTHTTQGSAAWAPTRETNNRQGRVGHS